MTMLEKMNALIEKAHAGQADKAGKPYVDHPRRVMDNLPDDADEELKCIALGHDLIEDTFVTRSHLEQDGFSERVIAGIERVTKVKGQTYRQYKQAVLSSVDSMVVKDADLEDNSDLSRLPTVTEKDQRRTERYLEFRKEIARELDRLGSEERSDNEPKAC